MPFKIVRNDITKMKVDAVVNTANEEPVIGDGVDTAIYAAAGEDLLLAERRKIGNLAEGEAAVTPGFHLSAKYIIHAVSPLYRDGESGEEEKLRSCYRKSLTLAYEHKCNSIAFPLIATGNYGYPKDEGMRVAVDEIHAFLLKHDMLIYLVVFDAVSTNLGSHLYPDLKAYIDHHYVSEKREFEYGTGSARSGGRPEPKVLPQEMMHVRNRSDQPSISQEDEFFDSKGGVSEIPESAASLSDEEFSFADDDDFEDFLEKKDTELAKRMQHLSDTFQEYLFYLMEEKDLTGTEVYKRAILTKQLFSKIKNNPEYQPNKSTAMRLCVGAKLNLDETKDLLARAGFALSPCDKSDIIFSFFIENKVYDMLEIDIALEEHGLPHFIE